MKNRAVSPLEVTEGTICRYDVPYLNGDSHERRLLIAENLTGLRIHLLSNLALSQLIMCQVTITLTNCIPLGK